MALLKYTGDIDLSRNGILDILKIQGPDFYKEGLSNNLEITTKDETGEESGSLILRSGSSNTTVGNVYLFAGSYTDLSKIKEIKGITLTTSKILLNHDSIETTTSTLVRTITGGGTAEFVEEIYSAEENNKTKGYSATANTKYDITSNTSTTLKNKALTVIAGNGGATAEDVDLVKSSSGYYTLYVPATTSGLSEEHIDKVNVRNLFSQTAGDFKLGDNSNNIVSRVNSIILNSSTLSSDILTSTTLTSPEITVDARDSRDSLGKGKLLVTSPNGSFRLEVDNKTEGKDISKLTIRDIESKNSTITNNITLSSADEDATIKVPKSLTVNAVKFTLNQVKDADGTADTSGNSILTSEIKNNAREAKLDVENATVNTKLTSSTESDLEGAVNINTDTGKTKGTLKVIGETTNIQSALITLGTSSTTSDLTTYIGTQTSNISALTENICTKLTRKLNTDDIVEEYSKSSKNTNAGDKDTGYYRITSKIPFTFTSEDSNLVDLTSGSSSLSIKGSPRAQDTNYGLILSSTDAKETLKDIILDNSYTQTEGTFTIAGSSNKATSVSIYSENTTVESTTLKEEAGNEPGGEYGYSLTVDNSTNTSNLSIRDALFNNEVQIKNKLTLLESSNLVGFEVTANGNTTLTAKKSFTFEGNDADNSDSILESTWTVASGDTPASRETSLTVERGTFKTSLNAKDSILTNTTTIEGESLSVSTNNSGITSGTVTIGTKNNNTGSLDIYRNNISLNGTSLAETTTSIKRSVNSGDYIEKIGLSTEDKASSIYQATSETQYLLKAYTKYDLYAGGTTTTVDGSMPLHISASSSSSEVKAVQLEATDHATIGNASKGGYVDIGAIRVKYDSSSQSLIFGAV